jgi:hypothetical protein
MDPATLAAVLTAVVTGASEALSGQLLTGLVALVKRSWHRKTSDVAPAALPPGEAELTTLRAAPRDQQNALALAQVLLARSEADAGFRQALEQWWARTEPVRISVGDATNTISGGTQHGPILQGRDFTNLTCGNTASPPPTAPNQ